MSETNYKIIKNKKNIKMIKSFSKSLSIDMEFGYPRWIQYLQMFSCPSYNASVKLHKTWHFLLSLEIIST